jgi:hypothetical protein
MQRLDRQHARPRRVPVETCVVVACASTTVATLVLACGSGTPPLDVASGPTSTADGAPSPPPADASPAAEASGSDDGNVAPADGSSPPPAVDASPDVGPYIDAPFLDRQGGSVPCNSEWWATDSAFDTTVTPPSFSAALNPIVGSSSVHPFTLVVTIDQGEGWTGMASGTATDGNGSGDQYFPPADSPSRTSMTVTSTTVATDAPEDSAWFHLHDAAGNDLWIPIAYVALSVQYGPTCDTLVNGTLTAVILASAASIAIEPIGQSATTIGALLGTQTSTSPAGWNVQMAFDGTSVEVD